MSVDFLTSNVTMVKCNQCEQVYTTKLSGHDIGALKGRIPKSDLKTSNEGFGLALNILAVFALLVPVVNIALAIYALDNNPLPGGKRTFAKILLPLSILVAVAIFAFACLTAFIPDENKKGIGQPSLQTNKAIHVRRPNCI